TVPPEVCATKTPLLASPFVQSSPAGVSVPEYSAAFRVVLLASISKPPWFAPVAVRSNGPTSPSASASGANRRTRLRRLLPGGPMIRVMPRPPSQVSPARHSARSRGRLPEQTSAAEETPCEPPFAAGPTVEL